jgi:hypothetical protein
MEAESLGYRDAGKELPAAIPSDPRYLSPPPTPPPAVSYLSDGGAESSMALLLTSLSLFFLHISLSLSVFQQC